LNADPALAVAVANALLEDADSDEAPLLLEVVSDEADGVRDVDVPEEEEPEESDEEPDEEPDDEVVEVVDEEEVPLPVGKRLAGALAAKAAKLVRERVAFALVFSLITKTIPFWQCLA